MLRLPQNYNPKVHGIIQKYLTKRIMDLVDKLLEFCYEFDGYYDEYLGEMLPNGYDLGKGYEELLKFRELLESPEEQVPELIMEYMMAHMIMDAVEESDPDDLVMPMPSRDYVYHVFRESEIPSEHVYYDFDPDDYDFARSKRNMEAYDNEDGMPSAYYRLSHIENMKYYLDELFWDTDYMLLDEYDEDQLKNMSGLLGL